MFAPSDKDQKQECPVSVNSTVETTRKHKGLLHFNETNVLQVIKLMFNQQYLISYVVTVIINVQNAINTRSPSYSWDTIVQKWFGVLFKYKTNLQQS